MSRHQRGFKVVPTKGKYIGLTRGGHRTLGAALCDYLDRGSKDGFVFFLLYPNWQFFVAKMKRHKCF